MAGRQPSTVQWWAGRGVLMPVFCTRYPERTVGLVRCFGRLTEQEFHGSISLRVRLAVFQPAIDRI